MPSFFLPDCKLYFSNAGVGGDFQQTKIRIRDQLVRLRGQLGEVIVKKLKSRLQPLTNENFYFHPFTMVPLDALDPILGTEQSPESPGSTYGELYRVVSMIFGLMQDESCTKEKLWQLIEPLEGLAWCKTAALCLKSLALCKFEDTEDAKNILNSLTNHRVLRSLTPNQIKNIDQVVKDFDWAWRFCLPCSGNAPNFTFLPEFTKKLLVHRTSRTGRSHIYVNFCCLSWSLQAELLGFIDTDAWFVQLEEYADFEEHMTIGHYSSSRQQVQFCLLKMEAILNENRLAYGAQDFESVEHLRTKLKKFVLEEYTAAPRRRNPQDWSDEDLQQNVESASDHSIQLPPMKETLLIISAKRNRSDLVRKLIENSATIISICDVLGRSALSWASYLGHLEVVETFSQTICQSDVKLETNRSDNMKQTPLMLAAQSGHSDVILKLLEIGADPNLEDRLGDTALTHAAKGGFATAVEILLVRGSSITHKDRFANTPLIWAARKGRLEVLKVLSERIHRLEDWEAVGEYRRTSLQWAEFGGHQDCADFIRECIRKLPLHTGEAHSFPEPENPGDPGNPPSGSGSSQRDPNTGADGATGAVSNPTDRAAAVQRETYEVGNPDDRLAIVINNIVFDDPIRFQRRNGAERDEDFDCLPLSLRKLGFQYRLFRDVTESLFEDVRQLRIFSEKEYTKCTAFLLCIMSHGKLNAVYSTDGVAVDLNKLFDGIRAHEWLKGKPKIFIVQACRVVPHEITIPAYPALANALKNEDTIYIYSVTEGDISDRLPTGTVFIQSFKDSVLKAYSDDSPNAPIEFTSLLPEVTSDVLNETERRQVPCYHSTLLKLLYFPKA